MRFSTSEASESSERLTNEALNWYDVFHNWPIREGDAWHRSVCVPLQGKHLHEKGVAPKMRSLAELKPKPPKETPLSGRRAGDAISGGFRFLILANECWIVKVLTPTRSTPVRIFMDEGAI
jgi:hypothetical protein